MTALPSHPCVSGRTAPGDIADLPRPAKVAEDRQAGVPDLAQDPGRGLLEPVARPTERIDAAAAGLAAMPNEAHMPGQPRTRPSAGPFSAPAVETPGQALGVFAPPLTGAPTLAPSQGRHRGDPAARDQVGDDATDGGVGDRKALAAQGRAELGLAPHRMIEAQALDRFDEGRHPRLGPGSLGAP
ncbi:hypothetical protein [Tepidamorphus gemmatus]|uniref:hypothetical protein n=1 Tax=Tepidamorphus gemmatus TaxID=747076 RepID=UPI00140470A8|nr:hypothetical protein [Tepidamorphus gemmatus]